MKKCKPDRKRKNYSRNQKKCILFCAAHSLLSQTKQKNPNNTEKQQKKIIPSLSVEERNF